MNTYRPDEPVEELRHIPIEDNGEPLVDFLEACPVLLHDTPRFAYKRATVIRESVARMLCEAAHNLPKDYRLAILEGWRPPYIQRRMFEFSKSRIRQDFPNLTEDQMRVMAETYTAPMSEEVPPPHTTGGAVDLFLCDSNGKRINVMAPFEQLDTSAFASDAQGLTSQAAEARAILRDALTPTGLTNYPSEYWHWSYGDQGWAYRGGHNHALYRPTAPAAWVPEPGDDSDDPLEWSIE